jgi:hypothetical protein
MAKKMQELVMDDDERVARALQEQEDARAQREEREWERQVAEYRRLGYR